MKKFEIDPSHVPRIDAHEFNIHFFNKLVFDIPQTIWFFGHLEPVIQLQSIHSNIQSQCPS
ncbi:hypothetical protein BGW80DRAFT_1333221 [Lactifluus volemus]|nr:hypothetical protein BGW80DRAFT_1333221 [Lactifluus volemus]